MPDFVGILWHLKPGDFRFTGRIEQAQFHPLRMGGEEREVHTTAIIISAQLLAMTRPNFKLNCP
ncbi:Uncharacterised protein [Enterobacter cancerogenus]|uniref:Uncharacterized protein n=1 Tax=Enterobacter cancerogenus TaxID=69218 RepID=A0A484Z9I2_9ENTR|nr:Uncharacterised protein [Enterobacter cancerogenus]